MKSRAKEWPLEVHYDICHNGYMACRKNVDKLKKSKGEVPVAWDDFDAPRNVQQLMTLIYIIWIQHGTRMYNTTPTKS